MTDERGCGDRMLGQTLSHYRIAERIGAGGMGEVYLAHDERLERDVALKILLRGTLADEGARKRFRKEALALSKLNHPNIATVFDFDTQDGVDFLVMEHVAGETLRGKLSASPLPEREIARLGLQLAEGLAAAHGEGIVHRDLKPGNVRLTSDGRLKILDFGLAKLVQPPSSETATTETMTEAHGPVGTLPYMAPEQLRGERVDARSDIWAAGVVLYEMATGRRAFPETESARLITAILTEVPPSPSSVSRKVSPGLESIIVKCLEKDPERRYQSAKELAVDLRRLETPSMVGVTRPTPREGRPRWIIAGVVSSVVALLALGLALNVGGLRERLFQAAPKVRSLAVLPLTNLSGDSAQAYFSDGMTEGLTNELGKIGALRVSSSEAVKRYKGAKKPVTAIARELGVDAVVTGSVARSGKLVRISAQIVLASNERQLWSGSYERDLSEAMILQGGMAQTIANVVRTQMTSEERSRLAGARPVNPDAYEAYLRGRSKYLYPYLRGAEDYRRAIRIDSTFAPAYASLSLTYSWAPLWGELTAGDAAPIALQSAARALQLDDDLSDAHAAMGLAKFLLAWDWPGARIESKRALELNPNSPDAINSYRMLLICMEQEPAEATSMALRKWRDNQASAEETAQVGWSYFYVRRYDDALEWLLRARALDPQFSYRWLLAFTYAQKGIYKEALAESDTVEAQGGPLVAIPYVWGVSGRRDKALAYLGQLRGKEQAGEYVNPLSFAQVYAGLRDKEETFTWLRRGIAARDVDVVFLKVEPYWDFLRSDPRFDDLLRQVGFLPGRR